MMHFLFLRTLPQMYAIVAVPRMLCSHVYSRNSTNTVYCRASENTPLESKASDMWQWPSLISVRSPDLWCGCGPSSCRVVSYLSMEMSSDCFSFHDAVIPLFTWMWPPAPRQTSWCVSFFVILCLTKSISRHWCSIFFSTKVLVLRWTGDGAVGGFCLKFQASISFGKVRYMYVLDARARLIGRKYLQT